MDDGDIYDLQERYVLLFDRSRTLSLNLFEHIHGESRDRGGAMVDLLETYRAGGFDLTGPELPDHLPVLLEFLSTRPLAEAKDASGRCRAYHRGPGRAADPARNALCGGADGAGRRSPGPGPTARRPRSLLSEPDDDPEDLEALDAVYEEAQVTFAPDPECRLPDLARHPRADGHPLSPRRAPGRPSKGGHDASVSSSEPIPTSR